MYQTAVSTPAWVPKRMIGPARKSRSTRWLIGDPAHLLIWWSAMAALGLIGIAAGLLGLALHLTLLIVLGPSCLIQSMLWIGADMTYIPRAFRAWLTGESWPDVAPNRR